MSTRSSVVARVISEAGLYFAVSAYLGSVTMHYLLALDLVFLSVFWTAYVFAVVFWGIPMVFFFGFVRVVSWSPVRFGREPIVTPIPPTLALAFGSIGAFLVGALVEANTETNWLFLFAVVLLVFGAAAQTTHLRTD